MKDSDIVLAAPRRTAIGSFGGVFREVGAVDLSIAVMKSAVESAGIDPVLIDDVIWGQAAQRTRDQTNHARVAALKAGIPDTTPGVTIHRVCVSGLWAIAQGAQAIKAGDASLILAGGTESYSTQPYVVDGARWGGRLGGVETSDPVLDGLHRIGVGPSMGLTAENLAEKHGLSREEQDELACLSQDRACRAIEAGRFRDEIVPVRVPRPRGEVAVVETDEGPRPGTTMEKLAKLPPAFKKGGTVTAGNSSTMNDAAAGILVASGAAAKEMGLVPWARIRSHALAGVSPDVMGLGPVPATRKALEKAGLGIGDLELIEINEAFAAQYLAVERELGLDRGIVNVNGGGISLGHPIGATGCRLVVSLLHEMRRRGLGLGLAALCGGGGVGLAMVVECL
ncbi:MAG: acetyl-CoA C-acyltransferase [Pseudomonadota bacterium]